MGDIHHLFPTGYLAENGINDRVEYSQVANFVVLETPINIRIGKLSPRAYMARVIDQVASNVPDLGEIIDPEDLLRNLAENAVPSNFSELTVEDYPAFLDERRRAMALRVRDFYRSL